MTKAFRFTCLIAFDYERYSYSLFVIVSVIYIGESGVAVETKTVPFLTIFIRPDRIDRVENAVVPNLLVRQILIDIFSDQMKDPPSCIFHDQVGRLVE